MRPFGLFDFELKLLIPLDNWVWLLDLVEDEDCIWYFKVILGFVSSEVAVMNLPRAAVTGRFQVAARCSTCINGSNRRVRTSWLADLGSSDPGLGLFWVLGWDHFRALVGTWWSHLQSGSLALPLYFRRPLALRKSHLSTVQTFCVRLEQIVPDIGLISVTRESIDGGITAVPVAFEIVLRHIVVKFVRCERIIRAIPCLAVAIEARPNHI
ncbi:hypothetical protein U1Q18_037943 [Sarracenia purpurea var. burkii]